MLTKKLPLLVAFGKRELLKEGDKTPALSPGKMRRQSLGKGFPARD
jgi:hypothetical protein